MDTPQQGSVIKSHAQILSTVPKEITANSPILFNNITSTSNNIHIDETSGTIYIDSQGVYRISTKLILSNIPKNVTCYFAVMPGPEYGSWHIIEHSSEYMPDYLMLDNITISTAFIKKAYDSFFQVINLSEYPITVSSATITIIQIG